MTQFGVKTRPVDKAAIPKGTLTAADILLRMPRLDADQWQTTGVVHRWLIMVRAAVLPMTVSAAVIAVLLAIAAGPIDMLPALLLFIGLVAAHATNNLINDWVDWRQGIDEANAFRARYGTHALQQGFVAERAFLLVTVSTGAVAVAAGLVLAMLVGGGVLYLMLAGAIFVVFYTWPLKHIGLGELAVFLVWGPMMIGGGYFVLTGAITVPVILVSIVYGIAPTLVILGKHMDKSSQDANIGIRTLPVLLGQPRTRLTCLLLLGFQWGLLAALMPEWPWLWLALPSAPAAWRLGSNLMRQRPETRPGDWSSRLWPLWFSALAFRYARDFGAALIAAMAISVLLN